MGVFLDRLKLGLLVNGNGEVENFLNNSNWLSNKLRASDDELKAIDIKKMIPGGFYFIHYNDKSNWMRYAPIFVSSYNESEMPHVQAVNFNFIPLDIRIMIFDKFITEKDIKDDNYLKVDYQGMYNELRSLGFEYALMEFNIPQVLLVHKVSLSVLDRFLWSQHPINKYDPKKLMEIMISKIDNRDKRHQELTNSMISDFYDISKKIDEKYTVLKGHIQRLQNSIKNSK